MRHYLLIDLGTGSTRAAIVRSDGKTLAMRSFFNRYCRDDAYPDAQYFLPADWEAEILRCCRGVHAECPEIRIDAVSAAGARQSIVLLDEEGKAFYGLPNIDNRGREFMPALGDQPWIYERSGKWVTEDFCAAKLLGLRKKRPELYQRIGTVLSLSGHIAKIFTGLSVFEPSQACETQLYDLGTKQWSRELCAAYGVDPALLPPLVNAGECVGSILPALRKELGMAEDAVFVAGGADTQAALLQTGIKPGDIAIVSGTTTPITALTGHKLYDQQQRVWVDANLGARGYLIEMNPGVTGLNYQRAKDFLAPDTPYEELERLYREKQDFRCTASFTSLLFYERRSLRSGGFYMPSPFPEPLDRVDMLWAVLADSACGIYEQLWRLRDMSGHDRKYILGCGGGLRSEALCRMIADLSMLELHLKPGFEQATLFGLVALCNEALQDGTALGGDGEERVYTPQENPLIRKYHRQWSRRRLAMNPA